MRKKLGVFFLVLLHLLSQIAFGQSTIDFDGLAANGFAPPLTIPNGYQGFNWNNFYVINTATLPASGFVNGTVSPSNVAATAESSPGITSVASLSSTTAFIIVSGYFTSAHQNGMNMEITGLNGASTVFDETFTLNVTGPSYLTFPSSPVTEIDITQSGGVPPGPEYLGGNPQTVIDDLTVIEAVPEPSTWALMICGAGLLGVLRTQRKK